MIKFRKSVMGAQSKLFCQQKTRSFEISLHDQVQIVQKANYRSPIKSSFVGRKCVLLKYLYMIKFRQFRKPIIGAQSKAVLLTRSFKISLHDKIQKVQKDNYRIPIKSCFFLNISLRDKVKKVPKASYRSPIKSCCILKVITPPSSHTGFHSL